MSTGRIFNNIKYIGLYNDNEFKKKTLEDNVYFTLRDIFNNAESSDIVIEVNCFNFELSNGIRFEERTDNFRYANILYNKKYLKLLLELLDSLNEKSFEFIEPEIDEEIDMNEYFKFDDWWKQFEELKKLLYLQYYNII
jgi:hypothetical protein